MKKAISLLLAVMFVGITFGQKAQRTSAYNYLRKNKLAKAKEAIEPTITNASTMNDPKTWFYRGSIYLRIALSENPEDQALDPNALNIAYESFSKAKSIDPKNSYYAEILKNMMVIGEKFYNTGVQAFQANDFGTSAKAFDLSNQISTQIGQFDTISYYYAGMSAFKADDKAMAKDHYTKLLEMNYANAEHMENIVGTLAEIYKADGDTAKALSTIQDGRNQFPKSLPLAIAETNIYLAKNQTDKAIEQLEELISMDATNPTIHYAVGTNYNQLLADTSLTKEVKDNAFNKARESYEKAVELKPDFFDAYYNLGALFVNKASAILQEANNLPLNAVAEYDKLKAEANSFLELALPALEKAAELSPKDMSTLISLKEIYTRLNKMDKLPDINQRIADLQQ